MKKVVGRKVHHEHTSKKTAQIRSQASEKARRSIKTEQLPTSDITYEIVVTMMAGPIGSMACFQKHSQATPRHSPLRN